MKDHYWKVFDTGSAQTSSGVKYEVVRWQCQRCKAMSSSYNRRDENYARNIPSQRDMRYDHVQADCDEQIVQSVHSE